MTKKYHRWVKEMFYPANLISILRIFLSFPFFVSFRRHDFLAASIFLISIIVSDLLDGFVARKLNQVSEIGKGLDPLADKIAMGIGIFIILKELHFTFIPFYIMIVRDLILIGLGAIAIERRQPITGSDFFGKLSTFLISIGTTYLFFYIVFHKRELFVIGSILYYAGTGVLLITCYRYTKISIVLLKLAFRPKHKT